MRADASTTPPTSHGASPRSSRRTRRSTGWATPAIRCSARLPRAASDGDVLPRPRHGRVPRVADVFEVLAQHEGPAADNAEEAPTDSEMGQYFRELADELDRKLKERPSAPSTSGLFLQELQGQNVMAPARLPVAKLVGPYGRSAHQAYEALVRGQEKKYPRSGHRRPTTAATRRTSDQRCGSHTRRLH